MADTIATPRQVDLEADLVAPRALLLPISEVHPCADNLRRTAAGADADRRMHDSVAAAGIFTPILVRLRQQGGYEVIDGHRRLAAAQLAGIKHVQVIVRAADDAEQLVAQAATNIVRAPLDPVDQWEAIRDLQRRGYTLVDAAHALGLEDRLARRMALLGQLHPDILAQIRQHGMPSKSQLALVASAPQKVQAAALKAKSSWKGKGSQAELSWHDLSIACMRKRLPRAIAIFDTGTSKVVFEEDLFAEPGSDAQFTTSDVAGFMKAQEAALDAEAAASKGKVRVAEWSPKHNQPVIPKSWQPYTFGPKPKGLVTFKAVVPEGYELGRVRAVQAAPKPEPRTAPIPTGSGGDEPVSAPPPAEPSRGPITKAGLEMLARAQTNAIRTHLRDNARDMDETELLELLLLALCGKNVKVEGERQGSFSLHSSFIDLAAKLVDEKGNQRDQEHGDLRVLAAEAIARMVVVTPIGGFSGSGDPAHWIGAWTNAADCMPSLDTPEFLATLSHDTLRKIAVIRGKPSAGTAKALRDALAGSTPHMPIPEATFGAPGPAPVAADDREED
jgi:ParB/RepB/Spo0J family partition protein